MRTIEPSNITATESTVVSLTELFGSGAGVDRTQAMHSACRRAGARASVVRLTRRLSSPWSTRRRQAPSEPPRRHRQPAVRYRDLELSRPQPVAPDSRASCRLRCCPTSAAPGTIERAVSTGGGCRHDVDGDATERASDRLSHTQRSGVRRVVVDDAVIHGSPFH